MWAHCTKTVYIDTSKTCDVPATPNITDRFLCGLPSAKHSLLIVASPRGHKNPRLRLPTHRLRLIILASPLSHPDLPRLTELGVSGRLGYVPVHHHLPKEGMLYQRDQYAKGGAGRWYWDFRDSHVFSQILPHHTRIVDVGCGEGIALEKLVKMFPERDVIGIDLEAENIEICKKFGLTAVYSDVNSLALPSSSFDFCIMIDVLRTSENSP